MPPAGAPPPALLAVLGEHANPPTRAGRAWRRVRLVVLVVVLAWWLASTVAGHRWWLLGLVCLYGAVRAIIWRRQRSCVGSTTVTLDGLVIHRGAPGRRTRSLGWAEVAEVYVRAPWTAWATAPTTAGETLALPGVSDARAPQLEAARAAVAAEAPIARATPSAMPAAPGSGA